MQIETRTVYIIGGASFDSEDKARQWIADAIGRTLDKALSDAGQVIGPKAALAVNSAMLSQAATLSILLGAHAAPVAKGRKQ